MTARHVTAQQVREDPGYARLKQHIIAATGLAYYQDKDDDLAARIAHRLAESHAAGCEAYLAKLEDHGGGELDALAASLTIGETFFFRHREIFDALRDTVVPSIIERNRQARRLHIWSAGCATGAEPYSLAILLAREFADKLAGWDVTIIGTDINREFLAQAQRGQFGAWAFRSAPDGLQSSCFVPTGQSWVIKDEFRHNVSFQCHNLVQHPFPSLVNNLAAFDLILCRNVMIYFEASIVRRLVDQFSQCLVDEGWFAVGHAEPNVDTFRAFRTVNAPGAVLYQKSRAATPLDAWVPPSVIQTSPSDPLLAVLPPVPIAPDWTATLAKPQAAPPAAPKRETVRSAAQAITLADVRQKMDRGQWAAASESCAKLQSAQRLNPVLHFYHALSAEQLGRHGESEQALRRAIYLDRDYVLAHYYLGLAAQRNRDAQTARRSFRNVLELLHRRDEAETIADADGLTVEALKQLSQMQLEVLERT